MDAPGAISTERPEILDEQYRRQSTNYGADEAIELDEEEEANEEEGAPAGTAAEDARAAGAVGQGREDGVEEGLGSLSLLSKQSASKIESILAGRSWAGAEAEEEASEEEGMEEVPTVTGEAPVDHGAAPRPSTPPSSQSQLQLQPRTLPQPHTPPLRQSGSGAVHQSSPGRWLSEDRDGAALDVFMSDMKVDQQPQQPGSGRGDLRAEARRMPPSAAARFPNGSPTRALFGRPAAEEEESDDEFETTWVQPSARSSVAGVSPRGGARGAGADAVAEIRRPPPAMEPAHMQQQQQLNPRQTTPDEDEDDEFSTVWVPRQSSNESTPSRTGVGPTAPSQPPPSQRASLSAVAHADAIASRDVESMTIAEAEAREAARREKQRLKKQRQKERKEKERKEAAARTVNTLADETATDEETPTTLSKNTEAASPKATAGPPVAKRIPSPTTLGSDGPSSVAAAAEPSACGTAVASNGALSAKAAKRTRAAEAKAAAELAAAKAERAADAARAAAETAVTKDTDTSLVVNAKAAGKVKAVEREDSEEPARLALVSSGGTSTSLPPSSSPSNSATSSASVAPPPAERISELDALPFDVADPQLILEQEEALRAAAMREALWETVPSRRGSRKASSSSSSTAPVAAASSSASSRGSASARGSSIPGAAAASAGVETALLPSDRGSSSRSQERPNEKERHGASERATALARQEHPTETALPASMVPPMPRAPPAPVPAPSAVAVGRESKDALPVAAAASPTVPSEVKKKKACRFFSSGTCRNGDACPFKHVVKGEKAAASLLPKAHQSVAEAAGAAAASQKASQRSAAKIEAQQQQQQQQPNRISEIDGRRSPVVRAEPQRRSAAAAVVQRAVRGLLCRRHVRRLLAERDLVREIDEIDGEVGKLVEATDVAAAQASADAGGHSSSETPGSQGGSNIETASMIISTRESLRSVHETTTHEEERDDNDTPAKVRRGAPMGNVDASKPTAGSGKAAMMDVRPTRHRKERADGERLPEAATARHAASSPDAAPNTAPLTRASPPRAIRERDIPPWLKPSERRENCEATAAFLKGLWELACQRHGLAP
jgi:hypothetical protein